MGCDIHLYSEVRRYAEGDNERRKGLWASTEKWRQYVDSRYKDGQFYPVLAMSTDGSDCVYSGGRNYALFAALAGVRNNVGVTPISYDKGLPDDVSFLIRGESDRWDCDGHSHSYLTLRELLAYDWTQPIESSGYMRSEYEAVQKYGDALRSIEPYEGGEGVRVTIMNPLSEYVSDFMDSINLMKSWVDKSSANKADWVTEDDIRIVFWFDN